MSCDVAPLKLPDRWKVCIPCLKSQTLRVPSSYPTQALLPNNHQWKYSKGILLNGLKKGITGKYMRMESSDKNNPFYHLSWIIHKLIGSHDFGMFYSLRWGFSTSTHYHQLCQPVKRSLHCAILATKKTSVEGKIYCEKQEMKTKWLIVEREHNICIEPNIK